MEMVKTVIKTVLFLAVAVSCSDGYHYSWEKFPMDGHRSGVVMSSENNVSAAMGYVSDSVYHAPSGVDYAGETAVVVAGDMIDAQPLMAHVKKVVGYAPESMTKSRPQSLLSNWAVDAVVARTPEITGVKPDVGILNIGGMRVDMPQGDVLYDDIASMFPFRNFISLVKLKGADLENIFKFFARKRTEAIGGDVRLTVSDGKIDELLVNGEPVDAEKVYTVVTVDFLLDGGDSLYVAKNAVGLEITDIVLFDLIYGYVQDLTAEGKNIESALDDRIIIK